MKDDHRIFVGNLNFTTTAVEVTALVTEAGFTVVEAFIIHDKETKRSRGFSFVELHQDDDLAAAITALNGKLLQGRELEVNIARPRPDRPKTSNNYAPGTEFGSPGPEGRIESLRSAPISHTGSE